MAKTKVLITVTTYPLPSRSYDELVCTAGVLEDGSWIRIYPVPFKFLEFKKYQWVELELKKPRNPDFRPESYSPVQPDLSDMQVVGSIDTKNEWFERKKFCLKNVYYNLSTLIEDSKEALGYKSLATFKPAKIIKFTWEEVDREWDSKWVKQLDQLDLFTSSNSNPQRRKIIDKIPYKFKYHFIDDVGRVSKMMIEDWEIGALYRNCLKSSKNEQEALEKVKEKYFDEIALKKDVYLFLGTTAQFHRKNAPNPFVIIGVFYPPFPASKNPVSIQTSLGF